MGPGARASDPSGSSNQAVRRETARTGRAIRQAGDPRVRDMALEPAPRRLVMNADRLGWLLIGECTSDNGVHVHRNANSMCAPALPYTAACLTVVARPSERRRRSGAFGRRWERPPLLGCLDRHRGGSACARPCHPPRGVAPFRIDPCGKAVEPLKKSASTAGSRVGLAVVLVGRRIPPEVTLTPFTSLTPGQAFRCGCRTGREGSHPAPRT